MAGCLSAQHRLPLKRARARSVIQKCPLRLPVKSRECRRPSENVTRPNNHQNLELGDRPMHGVHGRLRVLSMLLACQQKTWLGRFEHFLPDLQCTGGTGGESAFDGTVHIGFQIRSATQPSTKCGQDGATFQLQQHCAICSYSVSSFFRFEK